MTITITDPTVALYLGLAVSLIGLGAYLCACAVVIVNEAKDLTDADNKND